MIKRSYCDIAGHMVLGSWYKAAFEAKVPQQKADNYLMMVDMTLDKETGAIDRSLMALVRDMVKEAIERGAHSNG